MASFPCWSDRDATVICAVVLVLQTHSSRLSGSGVTRQIKLPLNRTGIKVSVFSITYTERGRHTEFTPLESPYFNEDIFAPACCRSYHFQGKGHVLVCGDLNARTGHLSTQGDKYLPGGNSIPEWHSGQRHCKRRHCSTWFESVIGSPIGRHIIWSSIVRVWLR
jgi:hypothetical protein